MKKTDAEKTGIRRRRRQFFSALLVLLLLFQTLPLEVLAESIDLSGPYSGGIDWDDEIPKHIGDTINAEEKITWEAYGPETQTNCPVYYKIGNTTVKTDTITDTCNDSAEEVSYTVQTVNNVSAWIFSDVDYNNYTLTSITLTAATPTYTITWLMDDDSVLGYTQVNQGDVPWYSAPTKQPSDGKVYTFTGWNPTPVAATADATYKATFSAEGQKFTVTWLNYDQSVLEVDENVEAGTMPSYDGPTPKREGNGQFSYVFSGWSPSISKVTDDITYMAQYTETTEKYTVTWKNWDGSVLETDEGVAYGDTPVYNGAEPSREGDAEKSYVFTGWSPEVTIVTKDVEYTAQFTEGKNVFTVTWKNYDGSVLEIDTDVPYGQMPSYDGEEPKKPDTETAKYSFSGWSPEVTTVTKNAEYTAQFKETNTSTFTITWKNYDGTVLETDENVPYGQTPTYDGATPTKPESSTATYSFSGWSPEVTAATKDAEYTAKFKTTQKPQASSGTTETTPTPTPAEEASYSSNTTASTPTPTVIPTPAPVVRSPQTGDSNWFVPVFLLLSAGAGLMCAAAFGRKKRKDDGR